MEEDTAPSAASDQAPTQAPTQASNQAPSRGGPQVLVVDDDPDLRDTLGLVLEEEGYAVRTASNGPDALAIIRTSRHPLVVVLDHHLRDSGGLAVLHALRAEPVTRQHAVVYMSAGGGGEAPVVQAELARLHVPYVRKPFDLEEFLGVVAKLAARLSPASDWRGSHRQSPHTSPQITSSLSICFVP